MMRISRHRQFLTLTILITGQLLAPGWIYSQSVIADTIQIENLNKKAWDLMYQNPDSSKIVCNKALDIALHLLEKDSVKENTRLTKTVVKQVGLSYNCLGVSYWITCEFDQSIRYHNQSMEVWKSIGSKNGQSSSFNNLGVVYKTKGDYSNALKNYFAGLQLGIEMGKQNLIAAGLSNIGIVYYDMNDLDRSLEFYLMAMSLYKQIGDMEGVSLTYGYIGSIYKDQHKTQQALECYRKGLNISEKYENTYLIAYQMNNLGEIYKADSNYKVALKHFQVAYEKAEEIGDDGLMAAAMGNMGSCYYHLNDFFDAEKFLKRALELSEQTGVMDVVQSTSLTLSQLYSRTGKMDKAYRYHVQYTDVHDSIFNDHQTREIGKIETRYEVKMEAWNRQLAEQEKIRLEKQQKFRADLLQYSGIVLSLVMVALVIMILGYRKVNAQMASAITFFAFLLLIEFLLVLLDPYVDSFSQGKPVFKLLLNIVLAMGIFPIHAFLEKRLKRQLVKKIS